VIREKGKKEKNLDFVGSIFFLVSFVLKRFILVQLI
jgi:hypothetical protein